MEHKYMESECPPINAMQVVQNKLLKSILHKNRMIPNDEIHEIMNVCIVKYIYECEVSFVNDIIRICPRSFDLYFQKRHDNYDVWRKNQLVVPIVGLCLGEKADRVTGVSLSNKLH